MKYLTTRNIILLFIVVLQMTCARKSIPSVIDIYEHRKQYKIGFTQDPRSPLTASDTSYLDFYDYDKEWNIVCTCNKIKDAKPFELPTYSGVTRTYIEYAQLQCPYRDKILHLTIYQNKQQPINPLYSNHLFLPFKDLTNGRTTYGGGRYINLSSLDIQSGLLIVDFNKAYLPWCAYSDGYNCPIPPKVNHIDFEIQAGEKSFRGEYKTKQ